MRFLSLFTLILAACNADPDATLPAADTPPNVSDSAAVTTGAARLAADDFAMLRGKRVGLIVNHTARVGETHLIDLAHAAPEVEVVALFGPEHGLRGEADAGEKVFDGRDDATGAPVYSLYGEHRAPTAQMLGGVDVLVFDIQDVGSRFYTYISTMGLSMQAAARAGIPFVVLDRPNPIGGDYVSGFLLEDEHESFVGQYPIPIAHGLTVGELARMIQGERMLDGLENLDLQIVEMEGWARQTPWEATGLAFIPPSPNIPDVETARIYAGTCLFEGLSASEGRGTRTPFRLVGAPWADGAALADTLNARSLPGVRFEAAQFTPESIEGMSSDPKLRGQALQGVRVVVTNAAAFQPVEAGVHVVHAFYQQAPDKGAFFARPDFLAKLAGTRQLQQRLARGEQPGAIIAAWQAEVDAFKSARAPYLLY